KSGLAGTLAPVRGVERQRDESFVRETFGVQACRLFLHAARRMRDDDSCVPITRRIVGCVEMAGQLQAGTQESDIAFHCPSLLSCITRDRRQRPVERTIRLLA